MLYLIVTLIVTGIVFHLLTRKTTEAPPVMSEIDLLNEGMTPSQARQELRAQRREGRQHARMQADALRAANRIGRTVGRAMLKK